MPKHRFHVEGVSKHRVYVESVSKHRVHVEGVSKHRVYVESVSKHRVHVEGVSKHRVYVESVSKHRVHVESVSKHGVHANGVSKQVNYLADESVSYDKGANAVISYIHHFLENYSVGKHHLQLNADQKKKNIMRWYLAWRVAGSLNVTATISVLPAGHTKFFPDWWFDLLTQ